LYPLEILFADSRFPRIDTAGDLNLTFSGGSDNEEQQGEEKRDLR